MFTKILVCSDGSDTALQAAKAAAEIARRFQADLTVLSVVYPAALMMPFSSAPEAAPHMAIVRELGEQMHTCIQQTTGTVLEAAGVPFQSRREFGHPVESILSVAGELKADLIVLGSRGVSEWEAIRLGSVTEGVLHQASCPVWIVRGEETTFSRILLASDGSAGAYQATLAAGTLAHQFAVPLTILTVLEPLGPLAHVLAEKADPESGSRRVREIVAARVQRIVEQADIACTICQEEGHPAETIVRYAREHEYPLIVMGNRGMSTLAALTLGSVSNRVARHASCSVLIVR
jgi:nucleotide-binding universal stress UspA family protein